MSCRSELSAYLFPLFSGEFLSREKATGQCATHASRFRLAVVCGWSGVTPALCKNMASARQGFAPTHILVIEDNPLDVKFLRYILEHEPGWNTEFIVVEDGDEAIDYLLHPDTHKPDLVILDLSLPKQDGIDVLKAIRHSDRLYGLRVAVFSSSSEEMMRSRIAQAGLKADDYIMKPIDLDEFSSLAKRFHHCCDPAAPIGRRSASA